MDPLAQIIWQSNLPLKRSLGERKRAHFGTQKRDPFWGARAANLQAFVLIVLLLVWMDSPASQFDPVTFKQRTALLNWNRGPQGMGFLSLFAAQKSHCKRTLISLSVPHAFALQCL